MDASAASRLSLPNPSVALPTWLAPSYVVTSGRGAQPDGHFLKLVHVPESSVNQVQG
jgi:hypothetical protein